MSDQSSGEPPTRAEPVGDSGSAADASVEISTDGPSAPTATELVDDKRTKKNKKPHSSTRNTLEWVAVIVGAVVVALLIKTFVVQAFRIPSDSMVPTLMQGDRVVVNKLSYDAHDLNRGDVVVFTRPPGLPAGPDDPKDLIKRVIGLPGDEIVARDGSMYVNDRLLEEPYIPEGVSTYNLDQPFVVPDDQVFVMGDNRERSSDSRMFGPIEADTVIGRAFMIMWPPGRIGAL